MLFFYCAACVLFARARLIQALDSFVLMQDLSVHDNSLISYEVLCREREIHLHTAVLERESHKYTDVIFQGVAAYHFTGDNLQTIICDIEEVDVERIREATHGERKSYEES